MRISSLLILQLALTSCSVISAPDTSTPTLSDRFAFPVSSKQKPVVLKTNKIDEASGLVRSVNNKGWLWTHNDSGDIARLFLIDPKDGALKMQVRLDGIKNVDFEDITQRTVDNLTYLVIGDIGDNFGRRDNLALHQIREPTFEGIAEIVIPSRDIETMRLQYTEGARDAETLMTAPNNELVIVTKRETENYIYQFTFTPKTTQTLNAKARIPLTSITAGDMNPSGEIVLRTYDQIYYWPAMVGNASGASETLSNSNYFRIPTQSEPQGEAICWTLDGGLYTLTEKIFNFDQRLYFYSPITHKK
jgi:hypothetical protein